MPAGVPSESWATPSVPLTFAQPEDAWSHLHTTFTREAQEAGVAGRRRCEVLFVGDSITEAMRGTQFGERYEELGARAQAFAEAFPGGDALAFGIAGDRTQHLLFRLKGGELSFRHAPKAVVLMIGTNNLGRDGDDAHDTFLGIKACAATVTAMLPGSKIVLPGILPRGPPLGQKEQVPPAPGETVTYAPSGSGILQQALANPGHGAGRAVGQGSRRRAGKYAQPGQHTAAIDAVNHELAALAAASGGRMVYVDAKPAFLDAQGDIVPEFMRDALHPSGGGYRSYFKRLVPVLDEIREAGRRAHREDLAARTKLSGAHQGHGSLASLDPEFRPVVEQLVAFTPHGVCLISPRRHEVVYANDAYFQVTGRGPDATIGASWRVLLAQHAPEAFEKGDVPSPMVIALARAIREGLKFEGRVFAARGREQGEGLLMDVSMTPWRNKSDQEPHSLAILRPAPRRAGLRDASLSRL